MAPPRKAIHRGNISITLPTPLLDKLKENAEKDFMPISRYIEKLVTKALDAESEKRDT